VLKNAPIEAKSATKRKERRRSLSPSPEIRWTMGFSAPSEWLQFSTFNRSRPEVCGVDGNG
jgi:hypothetical protein